MADSNEVTAAGNRPRISAYLITRNEADRIAEALASVSWMDEIVVLDSGSEDGTVAIAESFGARTSVREFRDFVDQKNRAMALCRGEWLFNLDADEAVSPELRKSIERVIRGETKTDVFEVPRRTWYLNRWIFHAGWYPQYRARLSRSDTAVWTGERIHERLVGKEPVERLRGDLLHRPYRSLADHAASILRYAQLFAERERDRGRRVGLLDLLCRPLVRFLRMYVVQRGFLDGIPGMLLSVMGGWYVFMKYARLYEMTRERE